MNPTRIAVVGAGAIGLRHVEEIVRNPRTRLAGIVDVAAAAKVAAAREHVPLHATLAALLRSDPPDAVVIATPNRLHVEQALECVAAGIPTLVEKPIADSIDDALRLVRAAERAGVPVLVGHHRRHGAILVRATEIVRSGQLGRIVAVMGSALFHKPDAYFAEGPWRREPGGGPILLNMIHEVDDLRCLVGEIDQVQASASNAARGFAVEDTVAMTFRFAGGALGTFLLSDTAASPLSWEQTAGENARYASYPDENCYVIAGDRGSLRVPSLRVMAYGAAQERSWFEPFERLDLGVSRSVDPLARQIDHLAAVARKEAQPLVTARDGLQNLRVTAAIVEAAQTGRAVSVPRATD